MVFYAVTNFFIDFKKHRRTSVQNKKKICMQGSKFKLSLFLYVVKCRNWLLISLKSHEKTKCSLHFEKQNCSGNYRSQPIPTKLTFY